jgi:drug/metabolite transporter (DMT)-like permease
MASTRKRLPWVVSAILSLIFKVTGTYMIGKITNNVWGAILMLSFGFLAFGLCLMTYFWITRSGSANKCLCLFDSSLFTAGTHKIAPGVCIGSIAGAFTIAGEISLLVGFYLDPAGQGITTSIIAGAAILSAFGAWIFYSERLSISQIIGIVMGTIGLILITHESALDGTYPAIISGFACLCFFTGKNISSRAVSVTGLDSDTNGILNLLSSSLLGIIFTAIIWITYSSPFAIPIDYAIGFLAGIMIAIGAYLLNESMMVGYVGPPAAIINTMGVWMVLFDEVFYGYLPSTSKIIGMIVAIVGAIWLLVGDIILYKGGCHS